MRVQEYEDEDEDDEPGLWTRLRSLLLNLSLQLYHRLTKVREQLLGAVRTLGAAADTVRLTSCKISHSQYRTVLHSYSVLPPRGQAVWNPS